MRFAVVAHCSETHVSRSCMSRPRSALQWRPRSSWVLRPSIECYIQPSNEVIVLKSIECVGRWAGWLVVSIRVPVVLACSNTQWVHGEQHGGQRPWMLMNIGRVLFSMLWNLVLTSVDDTTHCTASLCEVRVPMLMNAASYVQVLIVYNTQSCSHVRTSIYKSYHKINRGNIVGRT